MQTTLLDFYRNKSVSYEKCIMCGRTDNLERHHLIPRKLHEYLLDLNLDLNKTITLCRKCHLKIHFLIKDIVKAFELLLQENGLTLYYHKLLILNALKELGDKRANTFDAVCGMYYYECYVRRIQPLNTRTVSRILSDFSKSGLIRVVMVKSTPIYRITDDGLKLLNEIWLALNTYDNRGKNDPFLLSV